MRTVITILAVLLFTGWILCEVEIQSIEAMTNGGAVAEQAPSSPWRHTVDGWEKISDWTPVTTPPVKLHPVVVGLFLLFFSLFALIGLDAPVPRKS